MSIYSMLTLVVGSVLLVRSRRNSAPFGIERLYEAETNYKKEDNNPYHNKKYQSLYAYGEDKGVDGAAGMDNRLYDASVPTLGGYSDVHDLYPIEAMIAGMESDIKTLLLSEGLTIGNDDDDDDDDVISVISAQSQVVAGTNYRVSLYVGFEGEESQFVVIQFFVDLPVNDPSQTPKDLKLVKRPTKMLKSDTYEEKEKEDDNPYHNKKYESLYAYEDEGVDGAAGVDGMDDRLYGGSWDMAKDFLSKMSDSGLNADGVKSALSTMGAGDAGNDVVDIVSNLLAAGTDPVKLGIAAVQGIAKIGGALWNWDGFAWPGASWQNPAWLDLSSPDKAWVWTEEGTGRVFQYEYANRWDAWTQAMDRWWCTRILIVWNRDKGKMEVLDKRGMAWARQTIMDVANTAFMDQFKKNIQDKVVGHTITKADGDVNLKLEKPFKCLNKRSNCYSILDRDTCLASQDARPDHYQQPCVWCGGERCTTDNDNKCEPEGWLMAHSNQVEPEKYEYARETMRGKKEDGCTECLTMNDGEGCHTIMDRDTCLSTKDGRAGQKTKPCVWCGGRQCTVASGTGKCEPEGWLMKQDDQVEPEKFEYARDSCVGE